jgi:hypothetical protein
LNIVLNLETILEVTMKIILFVLIVIIFTLSACAPVTNVPPTANIETATPHVSEPSPISTFTTAPTDENLVRGNAFVDSAELLTMESSPLQFMLALKGSLPTPCNQLRVDVSPPDSENKIVVDVYSVVKADEICAQVVELFEENVPLGSFPAGHYTLWVNGELVTEFDA